MSLLQISLNQDILKLQNEGYEIEITENFLLVSHIPYCTSEGKIVFGKIGCPLNFAGKSLGRPSTHQVYFCGQFPCDKKGQPIERIRNSSPNTQLAPGIVGNHYFSSKPKRGYYSSYYEQVETYTNIISAPAISTDPNVTAKTFKPIHVSDEGIFQYADTNGIRSNLTDLNSVFKTQKIAIIGLGGTGAYVLDQVAKTKTREIRLFDADEFLQHNAFRAPGAASIVTLENKPKKVEYYAHIYSQMHTGIKGHPVYIQEDNIDLLRGLDYVFICIDRNSSKTMIIDFLLDQKIAFVDVGIDIRRSDDEKALLGTARVTACNGTHNKDLDHQISRIDTPANEYSTNIQIADLNCLNAMMAVIEWKKHLKFYQSITPFNTKVFTTTTGTI